MKYMCKSKIVFKTYNQQQAMLLPPDLDELIDINHPVRVINTVLDNLDIEKITKKYKGGGTSSYHPR
ncbi:MAG: IS1182 family transposase, partial [Chitinophagaceae bacterium]|nr:IS1182 family transposase [Chitinophagaceae bacterium]